MFRHLKLVVFLLLGSCVAEPVKVPGEIESAYKPGWPIAPQRTRIQYLYSFNEPEDLNYRLPFRDRFEGLLGGAANHKMIRPYAIAVNEEMVAVADPGKGSVHIFNTKRKTYTNIHSINRKQLISPIGIALGDEYMYIADSILNAVFVLDKNHKHVATYNDFKRPTSLTFDRESRRLYIADTLAHKVFAINRNGLIDIDLGERGHGDSQFNFPSHLTIANDRLYVNDTMNFRVQIFDLSGNHISNLGVHGDSPGYFSSPKGIAVNSDDYIFVAEALADRIQIFNQAGDFLLDFGFSGKQTAAFKMPTGLAILGNKIYVVDSGNHRVQVFEFLGDN